MTSNSLTAIVRTLVIVPSTDSEYSIPGDMNSSQVVASYASTIPGLSSMSVEETFENQTGVGRVRVLTYKPRTGTKGNGVVVRTLVIVPSTDSEYSIPGDMNSSQVVASYASTIPGLSSMSVEETFENQTGVGRVRVLTYKPRTGTKGVEVAPVAPAVKDTSLMSAFLAKAAA
jgi:hypothetical protein